MTPRRLPSLRRLGSVAAGLLLAATTLAWSAPAGAEQPTDTTDSPDTPDFAEALDRALADPRLDGARAGVVVLDAATGDTLYERGGDDRLMPASNTKLLTAAAALDILGPDHRYRTEAVGAGRIRGGELRGDLYLRGSGDPTMLAEDYDAIAADVAARGITRVRGDLVADDTRFDDVRLGRAWSWDGEADYYSAGISALTLAPDTDYDAGTVYVSAAPGRAAGDRPVVTLTPANDHVAVVNRATTVPAGEPDTLSVTREHGAGALVVSGRIPVGAAPTTAWIAVDDPTAYATAVFADALAAHGVRVTGDTVLGRAAPADATPLAAHESMPLSELLVPFLKLSNNMHAEALVKTIGHRTAGRGTWSAGLAAIQRYAAGLGMDTGGFRQVDGSGLSRMNLVPAAELATLLAAVRAEPWFDDWYRALPVACAPDRLVGGTLRSRMCGTPAAGNVRAKTGSLTGATGLSGYVTTADGRELVFSVLLNDYLSGSPKDIEDTVVAALAASGGPAPAPAARARPESPELECSWLKPALC
ncbi:D-alanyl-D-alanine carboxypeptidase/D-alanyl-D-alanine endopeptidase [Streptomyces hainanensis]|uniref:D-alanyl-D-alanine carboxypeptidase/D-alanyl-D-alanine-endopeptidase n=1 Tax=Streptomyces hainanensis TaxID=402648 RepID=A0A4V2Y0M8_9ACTN|nr:D-alanyl-D-alanine carboxypeptidase/D-alanyl-D-alanine-endopeptidase [Streptomyces hainanensis]TDC65465.1 D-alanyl-D-alanine carboxypeptidase/D-alanyl-D-alanine-endopeptidase [Streptomyces hainanensis]